MSKRPFALSGFLGTWALFLLIWLAASVSLEPTRLIAGLVVTGALAWFAFSRSAFWSGLRLGPARIAATVQILLVFLRDMIRSNIAMLGYVYAPRLRVSPRIIRVPLDVSGPRERLALTTMLALTPGTLVTDMQGDGLDIHVLDASLVSGTRESVQRSQKLLEKALG